MSKLAQLRTRIEALGLSGVFGIALLVFALSLCFASLLPLSHDVNKLRREAAALQQRYKMSGGAVRVASPDQQLATFYGFFPAPQSTPEWLGKINAAAQKNGIALRAGEYKLERRSGERLARYQIILPVQGAYPQLRAFIDDVLLAVPAASLDEITLQRENVTDAQLEARVRLTLYLGASG